MEQNRSASVAWFKLAELVSRGEKEKTLTLYRLLSHSFDERAYVLQVEGDILWAFEDKEAIGRYKQAAFLYQKENKIHASIAVYEHIVIIKPDDYESHKNLVLLYAQHGDKEKFMKHFMFLLDLFEKKGVSQGEVLGVIDEIEGISSLLAKRARKLFS
ncbi:hypothetical protein KKA53_03780 [Candidatus Dependentiae bacterium]|nr:hypothetical protein [Candidatus Dependentiae bacterium]